MVYSWNKWNTCAYQAPWPCFILTSFPFIIVNCPGWLWFLIHLLTVCVLLPLWGSSLFGFHISRLITCVICSPLFSIACNTMRCLWIHSKRENERIVCWITAGPEQKTDILSCTLTVRTWYCHFYYFFLCLYYNKQKIYELHSLEIWASISPQSNGGVKKQVYEYFLQEWVVKLTVKWVSERRSVQWILWGKAGTGSAAKNHLQS